MEVSERNVGTNDGSLHALAGLDGTLHCFHKLPKRNPALLDGIALQQRCVSAKTSRRRPSYKCTALTASGFSVLSLIM